MSSIENRPIPRHVAIIPDGNRRWARERGKKSWEGHLEGAKRVEEVSQAAIEAGVPYLTVWVGSYDNLTKRSAQEVKVLDRLYKDSAQRALKDKSIHQNEVRIRFLGEYPSLLSIQTVKAIREVEKATVAYDKYHLTYLIGYNGDREMLSAIENLLKEGKGKVTDEIVKAHLWTAELPPVDLVIRTGDDSHLSTGFMMWDTRFSLLSFSKKMWPDFGKEDFLKEIKNFSIRDRRLGS